MNNALGSLFYEDVVDPKKEKEKVLKHIRDFHGRWDLDFLRKSAQYLPHLLPEEYAKMFIAQGGRDLVVANLEQF